MVTTVTPADYRQLQAAAMSERDLQDQVVAIAKTCGWLCYHTHNSRRSTPGFPDLCMVRKRRVIFAELKTEKGKVTADQGRWLIELHAAGVETYLWRPADLLSGAIAEVLR